MFGNSAFITFILYSTVFKLTPNVSAITCCVTPFESISAISFSCNFSILFSSSDLTLLQYALLLFSAVYSLFFNKRRISLSSVSNLPPSPKVVTPNINSRAFSTSPSSYKSMAFSKSTKFISAVSFIRFSISYFITLSFCPLYFFKERVRADSSLRENSYFSFALSILSGFSFKSLKKIRQNLKNF